MRQGPDRNYLGIVEAIRDHGSRTREVIFDYLPSDLAEALAMVREVYLREAVRSRGRLDLERVLSEYSGIHGLERLLRYMLLTSTLFTGFQKLKVEVLYGTVRDSYGELSPFLDEPNYQVANALALKLTRRYGERLSMGPVDGDEVAAAMRGFTYGMRRVTRERGPSLLRWLARFRTIREYENALSIFYPLGSNERKRRASRTFIRWTGHETNVPVALRILLSGAYRQYVPTVDMYTALVTLRSGAFLAVDNEKSRELLRLILSNTSGIVLKLKSIKGLVRSVARLSGDPMLYERGAFDIGYRHCSKLDCGACPINKVCMRFTWVKVK